MPGKIDGGLALPPVIPCKVSSESAGFVTMSAVSRVDLPLEELAAKILGVCGKNRARVAAILGRGSLVSGDQRYRWVPLQVAFADVVKLLDRFPDHDPDRLFDAANCERMAFRAERGEFEITRDIGSQKRLFRRRNFWNEALQLLAALDPRCQRHSYSDKADIFAVRLPMADLERLRRIGSLLRFRSLQALIRSLRSDQVLLYVHRVQ